MRQERNSVADALLIELHATASGEADLSRDPHAFVTSKIDDFSAAAGDKRTPPADIAALFEAKGSTYALGVDGLNGILMDHFGEEIEKLFADSDFVEEPRRLGEITDAEKELFDRMWNHRSLQHEYRLEDADDVNELERLWKIARPGRRRVEERTQSSGSAC